jgi:hypothetical protein
MSLTRLNKIGLWHSHLSHCRSLYLNTQSHFSHKNCDSHSIPTQRINPAFWIESTIGSTQVMTWIHNRILPPTSNVWVNSMSPALVTYLVVMQDGQIT